MLKGYPVPGKAKAKMLCDAFIQGAPRNAEGAVFYGVKAGNHADWLRVRKSRQDFYFIDNSYFDATRGTRFRVTKNKLQWTGVGKSSCERFRALNIPILPWKRTDAPGYLLFCPQSDDHMRYTVGYPGDWLKDALLAHGHAGLPVRVRKWNPNKFDLMRTLAEDLDDASILVTHTSAAAVMATLAGVPVICDRQCAAFGMYGADRLWWAGVLADNEFTLDEMKDGTAWKTITRQG